MVGVHERALFLFFFFLFSFLIFHEILSHTSLGLISSVMDLLSRFDRRAFHKSVKKKGHHVDSEMYLSYLGCCFSLMTHFSLFGIIACVQTWSFCPCAIDICQHTRHVSWAALSKWIPSRHSIWPHKTALNRCHHPVFMHAHTDTSIKTPRHKQGERLCLTLFMKGKWA